MFAHMHTKEILNLTIT